MPRFFALVFLEHGQVRVVPPTIVVAFDLYRLDQYSFFRHDFVLAALAADFEGGGIFPEPIRPGEKVIRRAEAALLKKPVHGRCLRANASPFG
jgi:hypothetical protein